MRNCGDDDVGKRIHFEQPVLQTAQMFVGEMGCWLVVGVIALYRRFASPTAPGDRGYQAISTTDAADTVSDDGNDDDENGHASSFKPDKPSVLGGYRIVLLALPAICDICGTTLMNGGLLMVAASIYQMTRGALVLFVGLFSVLFLRRRLHLFQWLSLVGVVLGVAVVGLAGAISPDGNIKSAPSEESMSPELSSAAKAVIGVLLIAGAQIFTATQFVLEEWMLENSPIEPINVVGWEGIFGFSVTVLAMVILHLAVGRTSAGRNGYFDMVEGWRQMTEHKQILISSLLIMISIG